MVTRIFSILLFTSIISCGNRPMVLESKQYVNYYLDETNGLKQSQQIGDIIYHVQYKTPEMIALIENHGMDIDSEIFFNRVQSLDSMIWIELFMQSANSKEDPLKNNVMDLNEYNQRLNYYLSEFSRNISCEYQGIEIPCFAYHFENNYSLRNGNTALLGFQLPFPEAKEDIILKFDDLIFRNLNVRFTFQASTLQKAPKLKI